MDGTLIDSAEIKTWAFGKLYEQYGNDVVEKVRSHHLINQGVSRFEKFRYWHEVVLGKPYDSRIEKSLSQQFNSLVTDAVAKAPFITGAQNFLEKNYQVLSLFVASATPQAELLEIISRREMTRYFKEVLGAPKGKAQIIKYVAFINGWEPKNILMVGDALSDYEAARFAGSDFIGICAGESSKCFSKWVKSLPDLSALGDAIQMK